MTEELKFPIEGADSCPNCGNTERIMEKIIAKLKEDGKLSEEAFPRGVALQITLFDPKRVMMVVSPTIKIPTVLVFYDICAQCKTIYCVGVEMVETPARMQVTGVPPPDPDMRGGRTGPLKFS